MNTRDFLPSLSGDVAVKVYFQSVYRIFFIPSRAVVILALLFLVSIFWVLSGKSFFIEKKLDNSSVQNCILSAHEFFALQKEKVLSFYCEKYKVKDVRRLSDYQKLELSKALSDLYITSLLPFLEVPMHVYYFLVDTTQVNKIQTALMEQMKYNIPASVTLAQAAIETSYGRKVIGNNYFGIKAKTQKNNQFLTQEFFTEKELQQNRHRVLRYKKVRHDLYECTVQDRFEIYATAWESFRARSEYLTQNPRYASLFEKKNFHYSIWAEKLGSVHRGGLGYATNPNYGNLMKELIERYAWYLLDF
ncbi:MAG: glucosaminidase domain-containing protein [Cytophagales bacterium]|nr:glucosaminidase domain-containing protein [Cytophagales bacterium]MDW8384836.1 glucosaminidase domain-containing protein [Flammeovirgaceae bacterium]